jgi:hypothetical protein
MNGDASNNIATLESTPSVSPFVSTTTKSTGVSPKLSTCVGAQQISPMNGIEHSYRDGRSHTKPMIKCFYKPIAINTLPVRFLHSKWHTLVIIKR